MIAHSDRSMPATVLFIKSLCPGVLIMVYSLLAVKMMFS